MARAAKRTNRPRRLGGVCLAITLTALAGCASEPASESAASAPLTSSTSSPASVRGCRVAPETGVSSVDLSVGDRTYPAEIYRPEGRGANRLAAVIDLHGLDADGPTQAAMTGFRALADREGFVVAEPSGPVGPLGVTGWEIAAIDEPDRDDIEAISRLIDHLVEERCVDPHRVFVAGYSNGGFLAAELGCRAGVPVVAVAAVAGFHTPDPCERQVPTLVVHGTADPIVPLGPDGMSLIVDGTTPEAVQELLLSSIVDEVAASAAGAGCDPDPTSRDLAPGITESDFAGCSAGADHELILVEGGGHTWPGAAPTADADFLGPTGSALDATETIWTFFAEHSDQP